MDHRRASAGGALAATLLLLYYCNIILSFYLLLYLFTNPTAPWLLPIPLHRTLSSVQPHHPQVIAVLNALEACGWRDLPVGDDAVKKFLKKDAAWVLGPPGAAGRRFLFALSGEEHCCWVRRGVSPSTQLNNRSDVVTYECHRRRKQTRRAPDSSTVHGDDDDDEGFERRHLPHLLQL